MGAPHDKDGFRNVHVTGRSRSWRMLRWMLTRKPAPWPTLTSPPSPAPATSVADGRMRATLVNHATVLVQTAGVNILTDPIWSARCSPLRFAGPKRFCPPGLRFEDLPPIHGILLSHNHYDHLDLPTLRRLAKVHAPWVVTGLGNAPLLRRAGLRDVYELDWWQRTRIPGPGDIEVTATPAQHFSGRTPFDHNRSLWSGFMAATHSGSFFFAGDSGYADHFSVIQRELGPPRLALLPIGAYAPARFMQAVHMTPEDALQAHIDLGARTSVAIHHRTFRLTDEAREEPAARLAAARRAAGLAETAFLTPANGEGVGIP